ncbi:hypothetical protein [Streptomyces goshikiensis]|uniref:hypothetical protein n=1 Tax=Streptomyces goshikiensis TaxID=1942 RepID=UPI0036ADB8AF
MTPDEELQAAANRLDAHPEWEPHHQSLEIWLRCITALHQRNYANECQRDGDEYPCRDTLHALNVARDILAQPDGSPR